jgi:hypothetical protein
MRNPLIEVLTLDGCPHAKAALELVQRVVAELGVSATVCRVIVPGGEDALTHCFLGSPTIRVNGEDVEPGAGGRSDYVFSCRLYPTDRGIRGEPDERWLRDALLAAG